MELIVPEVTIVVLTSVSGSVDICYIESEPIVAYTSVSGATRIADPIPPTSITVVSSVSGAFVYQSITRNTVRWSGINSLNFTPDRSNIAGFKSLEIGGTMLRAIQLRSSIVVYSTKGVTQLIPISEPVSGWAERKLSDIGSVGRGAICACEDYHLFIDSDWKLCRVDVESKTINTLKIERLGYQEFLSTLTGSVIMSYDPYYQRVFIAGSNTTFIWNRDQTLTELKRVVSANSVYGGKLYVPQLTSPPTLTYKLISHDIDFGFENFKTLRKVEFAFYQDGLTNINCLIYTKVQNTDSSWTLAKTCAINNHGEAFPSIAATNFRIGLSFTMASQRTVYINSIRCAVQFTDKRLLFTDKGVIDVK